MHSKFYVMPKRKYKIAVIQLNLNDVAENNLKKCISWVKDAANKGAEVILLPELYSCLLYTSDAADDQINVLISVGGG